MSGWVGVDLDGTLAYYPPAGGSIDTIGEPIPRMLARVKEWLDAGTEVRIFTARVSPGGHSVQSLCGQYDLIRAWCRQHLGQVLPVTCCKDFSCIAIYDDRAWRVEANTGRVLGFEAIPEDDP